jgi:hypothetical protein
MFSTIQVYYLQELVCLAVCCFSFTTCLDPLSDLSALKFFENPKQYLK